MPVILKLIPVGTLSPGALELLADGLPRHLPVRPVLLHAPGGAPGAAGGGVASEALLEWLLSARAAAGDPAPWLGVAGHALSGARGETVFGEATVDGPVAVLAAEPLDGPDPDRVRHRLLTTATHEVGHLLGLEHCPEPTCGMYPSRHAGETDRKGPGLCGPCAHRIRRLLERSA